MPTQTPRALLEVLYYSSAQEYLHSLPLEHFMEATPQARQRKISWDSLDLVHTHRPEVQVFNELLVQYPVEGQRKPRGVVPDNMVVVHPEPIQAVGSFDLPLQPARPFWMLEYVSKSNKRKDYDDNFDRYEHELQVPYYLLFQPDILEMSLYRYHRGKYTSVKPNAAGRCEVPKLEVEVALLDDWVRFWFRGELVPLPADLLRQVQAAERRADAETKRANDAERRAAALEAEIARLRDADRE